VPVSRNRLLTIVFIIGFVVLPVFTPYTGFQKTENPISRKATVAYTPHAPVIITSDSDFMVQGWPGLGTPENPFVIEDLNITVALNCVLIANTTKHFVIRDCFLSATSNVLGEGVMKLENVKNAKVVSNILNGHNSAISVFDSADCSFTDNSIGTTRLGLYAFNISKSFFANNNQTSPEIRHAIHVQEAQQLTVRDNDFHSVKSEGFRLDRGYNCIIDHNQFRNVGVTFLGHTGLHLLESSNCHIAGNVLSGYDTDLEIIEGFNNLANNNSFVQSRRGVVLHTTNATISDNTIESTINGIELRLSNSCVVESNEISGYNLHGIESRVGNGSLFRWNTIHNTNTGILLQGGMHDRIVENHFYECMNGVMFEQYPGLSYEEIRDLGLYEWGAPIRGTVANNTFLECGVSFSITYPDGYDQIIEGNKMNGGLLGYFYDWSSTAIDGNMYRQLILARCFDVVVEGGNLRGVTLLFCTNSEVRNTNIREAEYGIYIDQSIGCLVSNSEITNSEIGVYIDESDSCYIYQSHIQRNNHGVYFYETTNSMVYGCEVSLNSYGIVFAGANDGIIESNRIHSNYEGIFLLRTDNTMVGNNEVVFNNGTGILINRLSNGNRMMGNSFGWNGVNAVCTEPDNYWDNGVGLGNRWHNYFGTPTYVIEGGSGCEDRFPSLLGDGPLIPIPTDNINSTMDDPFELSPLQSMVAVGMIGALFVIAVGNYVMKRFVI